MNPDHPSREVSMSPQDVTVEQDGYMSLSNITFGARVPGCALMEPMEPAGATRSMPLPGCSPFTRGRVALS